MGLCYCPGTTTTTARITTMTAPPKSCSFAHWRRPFLSQLSKIPTPLLHYFNCLCMKRDLSYKEPYSTQISFLKRSSLRYHLQTVYNPFVCVLMLRTHKLDVYISIILSFNVFLICTCVRQTLEKVHTCKPSLQTFVYKNMDIFCENIE